MAESTPTLNRIDSSDVSRSNSVASDTSSLASGSPRSLSPTVGWTIKYKNNPKKAEPKGVWDGYQTREEFITMHLR